MPPFDRQFYPCLVNELTDLSHLARYEFRCRLRPKMRGPGKFLDHLFGVP